MSRPKKADQIDAAEKLLASAKKLFLKNGYERVTIREIADDAKVNSALIQYYFGDKAGLYQAVLDSVINSARELMQKVIKNQKLESIEDLFDAYYKVVPFEFVDLAVTAMLNSDKQISKYLRENLLHSLIAALESALANMQKNGQIRKNINVEYLRIAIQSMMVFPVFMRNVLPRTEKSNQIYFEQLAHHHIEILSNGAFIKKD